MTRGWRLAVLSVLVACGSNLHGDSPGTARRPNVLFISVDDLNHWIGYLGRNSQAKTPNIDRLAARGVAFTRSYCAAPVCNPSRAALMSGKRPGTTGVYDNAVYFGDLIPPRDCLTSTFRNAGYFVCGAGKIYHSHVARPEEWDDYATTRRIAARAEAQGKVMAGKLDVSPLDCEDADMPDYQSVSYGIEQLNRRHEKPFFLAIGIVKPHLPFSVPRQYYDMHPLDRIELPPYREDDLADIPPAGVRMALLQQDHEAILRTGTWKLAIQAYLAAGTFADAMIGRLLDALDRSEHRDNTIVVFWCDHGWHLGEKRHWRKFALWEEATRSPMIWVVPGLTSPGRCDRTVDFMSVYPTLCDLCGVETPKHVDGKSIRSLLANPAGSWSDPAITTHGRLNHAVRTERWRYIRYADGTEELYDAVADPYEWKNLAGDAAHDETKRALAKHLPTMNVERPETNPAGKQSPKSRPGTRKNKAA